MKLESYTEKNITLSNKKNRRARKNALLNSIASLKKQNQQLKNQIIEHEDTNQVNKLLKAQNEEMNMQKEYLQAMVIEMEEKQDEIETQKMYLQSLVAELESNEKEIKEKNKLLENTLKTLNDAYSNINASLYYSKRIQNAMLPQKNIMNYFLEDNFLLFKPKDIVSGDFYWFSKVGHKFIVAAVDCTGHGVPGALISIIGMEVLHQIINERKITEPNIILEKLNESIIRILKQNENDVRDGMDMSIISIDKRNKYIDFAGARNPLLVIKNHTCEIIKGDRNSIGGFQKDINVVFTQTRVNIDENMSIYLFSDGFQDLYNEKTNRRLGSAYVRKILTQIAHLPMKKQEVVLGKIMKFWQKTNAKQLDDIMVIGIKF
jgi:serine phosphatase RsbU (regulator of sigma subunit)